MGNRFGRRKKKRMREIISALKLQIDADEIALERAKEIQRKAVAQTTKIAYSVEKISRMSAALPVVREHTFSGLSRLMLPIPPENPMECYVSDKEPRLESMILNTVTINMHSLQTRLEENRAMFLSTIHLEFDNGGPRCEYQVSGQVLEEIGHLPFVKEEIVMCILDELDRVGKEHREEREAHEADTGRVTG